MQIYEIGEHNGLPYIVMEYVASSMSDQTLAGTNLRLRRRPTSSRPWPRPLHDAHQHGIIHPWLKPANILLTPDGTPKIGDFALLADIALGRPAYMAPEQIRGRPHGEPGMTPHEPQRWQGIPCQRRGP